MIPVVSKDELWTRPFHILPGESKANFLARTHEIESLRRACKTRPRTDAESAYMVKLLVGGALRINMNDDHEVRYWMAKFGVTEKELRDAVRSTGVVVTQVHHYLSRSEGLKSQRMPR